MRQRFQARPHAGAADGMNTDALIIGGGVIGLAIARELRLRGLQSVTVLERGLLGKESSDAAAGMLAAQAETESADRFFDFCRFSGSLYPALAESLLEETGIDIELDGTGTLYLALDEHDSVELQRRFEWQSARGLNLSRLEGPELLKLEPALNPGTQEGLFFPEDRQVENRRLIEALSLFARRNGVDVIEGSEALEVRTDGGRAVGVRTAAAEHRAGAVILASGAWTSSIGIPGSALPTFKPVKGQMLSFGTARGLLRHVVYSPRGYIVPRSDGRVLAGSTTEDAGFDKSVTSDAAACIKANAFEIAPKLRGLGVREQWAGLRPWREGGRPLIGRVPGLENVIVAAGHFRNGILLAPATASLTADMVCGAANEFASDFAL